jgi:hypothetical protein
MKLESIMIYPKNAKQKTLLKSCLEEMKIQFEIASTRDETLLNEKKRQKKRIFGNMIYSIELTFDAQQDIESYKTSGYKKILIKMDKL